MATGPEPEPSYLVEFTTAIFGQDFHGQRDRGCFPCDYQLVENKRKRRLSDGVVWFWKSRWWRRRESNPRPQALYRQYYMLSLVI